MRLVEKEILGSKCIEKVVANVDVDSEDKDIMSLVVYFTDGTRMNIVANAAPKTSLIVLNKSADKLEFLDFSDNL